MQAGPSTLPPAHRLHISGISSTTKTSDLHERFSRYGTVEGVDTVGPDALGRERTYAFLTLRATPADFAKCMNTMQGAMWRGGKLKIGEAKLRWDVRLEQERNPALAPPVTEKEAKRIKLRKRKLKRRSLARCNGTQLADMSPVNPEKATGLKHWSVNAAGLPVRPLYTRPTHPIPASKLPNPIAKSAPATTPLHPLRKSNKRGRPLQIKRARRVYLDPGLWDPTYLGADDLAQDEASDNEPTEVYWLWVGADTEAGDLQGRWERRNGDDIEAEEPVPAKRARVAALLSDIPPYERQHADTVRESHGRPQPGRIHPIDDIFSMDGNEDEDDAELWGALPKPTVEDQDEDAALFPSFAAARMEAGLSSPGHQDVSEEAAELGSASEDEDVFGSVEADENVDMGSPLFGPSTGAGFDDDDDNSSIESFRSAAGHLSDIETGSSPSPENSATESLLPGDTLPQSDAQNDASATSSSSSSDSSDESSDASQDADGDDGVSGAGDGSDSSDDSTAGSEGGPRDSGDKDDGKDEKTAGDAPENSSDSDEDSDDDDESDEDDGSSTSSASSNSESSSDADSSGPTSAAAEAVKTTAAAGPVDLKAIFGAPPSQGSIGKAGALFSTLDLDLDEDMGLPATSVAPGEVAATEPARALEPLSAEPLAPLNQARSAFVADPNTPLFFISSTKRAGGNATKASAPSIADLTQADGYIPFHRQETDQQMTDDWNANKLELTREYKKRHREAVKRRRRGRADHDQEE